jgi:hypothetical protein
LNFQNQTKKWLDVAEANKPVLNHKKIFPKNLVEIKRSKLAFHGWSVKGKSIANTLFQHKLSTGDSFTLDFGEHVVGYLHFLLTLIGEAMGGPLRLKFVFGEIPAEIAKPFDSYTGTLSRAWLQDETITVETLPSTISLSRRLAFQYLKVEVIAASFDYKFVFSDLYVDAVSSAPFDTDPFSIKKLSPELKTLDMVGLRTLRNGMQTVFEDGPKRDRRLWLADSPLQALTNYYSFKNYDLVKRCIYLFAALIYDDGRLPACVYEKPSPHRGSEFILDFSILYSSTLLDYGNHSNDWESVRELWPVALKQFDFIWDHIDEKGLFKDLGKWWVFIDWQPKLDKQAPMQGLILYCLHQAIALAAKINRKEEVFQLIEPMKKMTEAARNFLQKASGELFHSGEIKQLSWASQIWMILGDVVNSQEGTIILKKLLSKSNAIKPVTPFIYHYAVEAMLICNMREQALELIKYYWGGMISHGANTFWEVYDPENPNLSPYNDYLVNSYCHSWSCTPSYFLRKYFTNPG